MLEDDGQFLTQTALILLRLAERYGRFAPEDEAERFEVLRWLFFDNQKLSGPMAAYRFRRAFTRDADPAVMDYLHRNVDSALGIIDGVLSKRPFIAGNQPTVADIAMCGYLMFPPDESGYDLIQQAPSSDCRGLIDRDAPARRIVASAMLFGQVGVMPGGGMAQAGGVGVEHVADHVISFE